MRGFIIPTYNKNFFVNAWTSWLTGRFFFLKWRVCFLQNWWVYFHSQIGGYVFIISKWWVCFHSFKLVGMFYIIQYWILPASLDCGGMLRLRSSQLSFEIHSLIKMLSNFCDIYRSIIFDVYVQSMGVENWKVSCGIPQNNACHLPHHSSLFSLFAYIDQAFSGCLWAVEMASLW